MKRRYDEEIFYLTGCDVHQYARFDGALVAQQILRHKTQKRSFRLMFWLTVFSNAVSEVFRINGLHARLYGVNGFEHARYKPVKRAKNTQHDRQH